MSSNYDSFKYLKHKFNFMISSYTLQFFYYFVSWNELDYAELIAEQLHNNADSITDKRKFLVFKPL